MFGYHSDHLQFKEKVSEDQKQQMIAAAWPAILAARLLVNLVVRLGEAKERDLCVELWKVWEAGRSSGQADATAFLEHEVWSKVGRAGRRAALPIFGVCHTDLPVRVALDPSHRLDDEQFLAMLVARNVSHKGTDVRLDIGLRFAAAGLQASVSGPHALAVESAAQLQVEATRTRHPAGVRGSAGPPEEVDPDSKGGQEGDPHGGQPRGGGYSSETAKLGPLAAELTPPDHLAPDRLQRALAGGMGEE